MNKIQSILKSLGFDIREAGNGKESILDTLKQARFEPILFCFPAWLEIRRHAAMLADALARLPDDFEYDEILALIQQAGEGSEANETHSWNDMPLYRY